MFQGQLIGGWRWQIFCRYTKCIVSLEPNAHARGTSFIGCSQVLIQYISRYALYVETILQPQFEDSPWTWLHENPDWNAYGSPKSFKKNFRVVLPANRSSKTPGFKSVSTKRSILYSKGLQLERLHRSFESCFELGRPRVIICSKISCSFLQYLQVNARILT
jgi:hypothetical protein